VTRLREPSTERARAAGATSIHQSVSAGCDS
jgi:hypothetical protein